MRDLETISTALTAAETGHLVFATLHTQDAPQSGRPRDRRLPPPPAAARPGACSPAALQGVVAQQLLRDRRRLAAAIAAVEVIVCRPPAVRNLIREGKTHQIYSAMQAGQTHGMTTMDQNLADLVRARKVAYATALERCHHVEDFKRLCGRI